MDKDSEPFQHEEDFNSIMEVCYGSAVHVMVCAAVHNTMSFRLQSDIIIIVKTEKLLTSLELSVVAIMMKTWI